jgi:GH15 family glucan-1,4-alpha-glucosidase
MSPEDAPDAAPIGDYALISDCQGAALVAKSGSIDWACFARFDAPSVFARLLDRRAGHWQIAPVEPATVERSYLSDTMVVCTTFHTSSGVVALTDAMAFGPGEEGHRIGHASPHMIIRSVEGIDGAVDMEMELTPRPEYGITEPIVMATPGGARTRGGPRSYVLSTDVALEILDGACRASFRIKAGETRAFALGVQSSWIHDDDTPSQSVSDPAAMLDDTIRSWRSWSSLHQSYDGPYAELVRHSGRVLQALTYAPTGAIVAAPTTSLPETVGGSRNWDYRFCWVRDASLTLEALWVAACPDEAGDFFGFLATAAGGHLRSGSDLQILYGVEGERVVPERELDYLDGYRASRPVRIGNGAWNQIQLDVYGELLSAAGLLSGQIKTFDDVTAHFLTDVADAAAARWREPDQGIWEIRGEPRHFVHSKLMCWIALDRAIELAPMIRAEHRVQEWSSVRREIRAVIEDEGWSERAGAYAQSFGSDELDASCLLLLMTGFLPPTDPRMRATVEAIAARLTDKHGFVYRYRTPDGLDGEEGTFAICTFWLVQCLAELGEVTRARDLFDSLVSFANDVGLFAEQIDTATGELVGNFPQAFTHIGLVNAAWAIARAEGSVDERTLRDAKARRSG